LHGTRELELANLVTANNVDVVALSEAEVPASKAQFSLNGFTTFCPLVKPGEKTRVMLLVSQDKRQTGKRVPVRQVHVGVGTVGLKRDAQR
jgi:hypothetical protein